MGHLAGRSALVTGSGIGIGEGIARELARAGARVALHYAASAEGAHAAMAEITAAGGEAIALQGDLRFVADCARVVNEAAEAFGGLDILVN
ncbi:MAG: SDR family NAD(P)-dependent oxidoreductase, partial [Thermomicrobiales bacterium]|nr:SDR family NAD(P)-dependent oxidoreductase [Thermomicrobiales bacterium]